MNKATCHTLRGKIAAAQNAASVYARRAEMPQTDPRDAHEAENAAEREVEKAEKLAKHLVSNEKLAEEIEKLLRYLAESRFESRERSIVKTKMEEAVMWLWRENG